ncbi:Bug family tripartite tricarboxylate transporter substrate binding protein [Roseomonas marmotae]|uniref:Tripartite tricarboxylate transporter substrate binding protein n=1 Tax=Roseomonas marmotae TaxID=2768161 RepID=A0ABS3KC65_9PROT|nr:tripartite tricarboxylate transporter substrate binding protein [Roseomonas marmotae]MBO1075055.1 tripartite tricarboxylate transporter substrate binding protein [Roseomonas marmotae]QTI79914.1 tripartite tricarboxylate transporter substrate binding protein [Roseomonas marmotae]
MRMTRRALSRALLLAPAASLLPAPAIAAGFPDRPIKLVVPYPPGGSTDPVARLLAAQMQSLLGQPMIVENRSGAAGAIGTESVARAEPDGYTLLLHTTAIATEPSLKSNLPYRAETDLLPLTEAVRGPYLLVANPRLPAQDLDGLIAHARAHPGKLLYGSAGIGSSGHLIGALFAQQAGIEVTHVPYRGGGPSITGLLANEIQYVFDTIQGSRSLVQDGQLRGLAVTGSGRSPLLPQVPTAVESGMKDFDIGYWLGIFAPARIPAPVAERLNAAFRQALGQENVRTRLTELGLTPVGSSLEEFGQTVRGDMASWHEVIRKADIRLE